MYYIRLIHCILIIIIIEIVLSFLIVVKLELTNIDIMHSFELLELCNDIICKEGSLYTLYKEYNSIIFDDYFKYISFSDNDYKRNKICSSDYVDIYLICWKNGQKSKIHDHPDRGCVMYVLDGELKENIYYSTQKDNIEYGKFNILINGESSYNHGSSILHQIVALRDTVSLHIYHKDYIPKYYDVNTT